MASDVDASQPALAPPLLVIGGSAGATQVIGGILAELPTDFPWAIVIVVHLPPGVRSNLAAVLDLRSALPVRAAEDHTPLRAGQVMVAVPDRHLMIVGHEVRVVRAAKENGMRPAIDALFRTAARAHGARVTGLLVSGTLDCGVRGLADIRRCGGVTIVQDPRGAEWADLPQNAIDAGIPDHVLAVPAIPAFLVGLSRGPQRPASAVPADVTLHAGTPSGLACPACGGALWSEADDRLDHFACHTGHRYSGIGLKSEKSEEIERALFAALRGFHESVTVAQRLSQRARERGDTTAAASFLRQGDEAAGFARVLVGMLDDLRSEKGSMP